VDSAIQTITINITDENDAPTLPATAAFNLAENASDTDPVGAVTATDVDLPANTLTYAITGGTGTALFNIDPATGNITVNGNNNFDFESGTTSYTLDVVANDGSLDSNTQTITINITDANDAPILPPTPALSIGENASDTDAVGSINGATDEDLPANTITYAITGGTGAALFNIDNSGNITVNGNDNFNFEGGTTSYTLDIVANDGNLDSNTQTITINITDENDAPVLPSSGPFSINEDANNTDSVGTVALATDEDAADTITYSIEAGNTDAIFTINTATGEITIDDNTNLDFESTASYDLTIRATTHRFRM